MEENGVQSLQLLDRKIESLRDLKSKFLSRMTEDNKKDTKYWTRQIDKEIRKLLKCRDQFLKVN